MRINTQDENELLQRAKMNLCASQGHADAPLTIQTVQAAADSARKALRALYQLLGVMNGGVA